MSTAISQPAPWINLADQPQTHDASNASETRRALAVADAYLARSNSSLALAERCMTDLSSRLHCLQRRLEHSVQRASAGDDERLDQSTPLSRGPLQRQIDVAMESLTALSGTTMAAGYDADAAAREAATTLASAGILQDAAAVQTPSPKVDGKAVGLLQNVAPRHLGDAHNGRLMSITRQRCNSIASGRSDEAQCIVHTAIAQMASLHDDLIRFKAQTVAPLQQQVEQMSRALDPASSKDNDAEVDSDR